MNTSASWAWLWLCYGLRAFVLAVIGCSFFEWCLHKFVMHRPFGSFTYPFKRHAMVHHQIFKADHTYHLLKEEDKHTIPMAWWNGPALIAGGLVPVFVATFALGSHWFIITSAAGLAMSAYYCIYEYIHWCMHLPRKRNVERSGIFFRLNGHHLLHHRYMHRNFNVVLPLADLLLGTLLLRSKVHFKQATGPSVPDVQPRIRRKPIPFMEME